MKQILPFLALSACVSLPNECKPYTEAVEQKCREFGPQIDLNPELAKAKACISGSIEAVCTQNHALEPRQVKWTYNQ